jgi:hypothetical protein
LGGDEELMELQTRVEEIELEVTLDSVKNY